MLLPLLMNFEHLWLVSFIAQCTGISDSGGDTSTIW